MEKELAKRSEKTPSKATIASFVHDMKEIESQQFTLEKTRERCQSERYKLENRVEKDLNSAEGRLQYAKKTLNEARQNRAEKPKEVNEPKKVREPLSYFSLFGVPLLLLYITLPAAILDFFGASFRSEEELMMCAVLLIIAGVLMYVVNRMVATIRYEDYKERLEKYNQFQSDFSSYRRKENDLSQAEKNLSLAEKALETAKKKKAETAPQLAKLNEMVRFLTTKISEIEKRKQKLYSLNIVPPDYRELDCMIEFDQIFRNDLADTMREAIKIYDERVFRGEVIRGVDKIYTMMGELVATMLNIESALYGIQSEVRLMSDELYKFTSNAEKTQEDLLSETRAAHYATEALQKTQERCEWYMNRSCWNT